MYPIADLHCDLLAYLKMNSQRTAYDPIVRCSIPQLREGAVKLQTLAIFAETGPGSFQHGLRQAEIYDQLPRLYPNDFVHFHDHSLQVDKIAVISAFEGASTFCDEQESIQEGLKRLDILIQRIGKPLYISLTWNMENRFGGGTHTNVGLKEDGKRLLDKLHQQGIAVDLSHASDALAYEMINYIDRHALDIPIIASHSNSRTVFDMPRNLPDPIAKEIIRRKGLIGFNLYHPFIGPSQEFLVKQLVHWLEMGGEKSICFGADFFCIEDFPHLQEKKIKEFFLPSYENASCYGRLLEFLQKELNLDKRILTNLASRNVLSFLQHKINISNLNIDYY